MDFSDSLTSTTCYDENINGFCDSAESSNTDIALSSDDSRTSYDYHDGPPLLEFERRINGTHLTLKTYYPENCKQHKSYKDCQDSEHIYKMNTFPRGKVALVNMKYFESSTGLSNYPRTGAEKDANELQTLFLALGFVVDRYDDISKCELYDAMRREARDSSGFSCFVCFLLSHGEEGLIYVRDGRIGIKEIGSLFVKSDWVGKPKLFFIQACQGDDYMDGVVVKTEDCVDAPGNGKDVKDLVLNLPSEADFLYAYSTVLGCYSWRNTSNGSWFIQSLVEVFREHAHKLDLVSMMTRINKKISQFKSANTGDERTNDKRQISSIVTQLRKDLFFFPPKGKLPDN